MTWVNLIREEDGATAVEYAIMVLLIILACIGTIGIVGEVTAETWGNNNSELQNAFDNAAP